MPRDDCGRGAKILKMSEEIENRQSENADCSTKQLPPKLKQKSNQNVRYPAASEFPKISGDVQALKTLAR